MDATVSPVKRFTRYEIVRKLGRSMTDVYLAFDSRLDRLVILKIIEQSGDDLTRSIIEAERRGAQIQSELHRVDSRILEIYECGDAENCFFVSMEYFEGHNIADLLRRERRLEPKRAARYAAEVCSQLGRLHSFVSDVDGKRRAVIHGDIKPSNIQIGANDEVRLLDFGISKVITYTRSLTQHNLGSPTYCSPERLAKGQVDPQADLWALAVSLYEMIAGSPPYQAEDTRKLEILIESKRAPRALPESCPRALAAIATKALSGEVDRRYQSAADFENDLRAFLAGKNGAAFEERPSWQGNTTIQKPRLGAVQTRLKRRLIPQNIGRIATRVDWIRWSAVLSGVAAVFLLAYLTGRMRDQFFPTHPPFEFSHASDAAIDAEWRRYVDLRQHDRFLGRFSPAYLRARELKAAFVAGADETLEGYRNSADASLDDFDWDRAKLLLRHAVELDPNDRSVAGKLDLVEGYRILLRSPKLPRAAQSEARFRRAAANLPRSPDPHLALARLYVYSYENIGRAIAEVQTAERLGFRPGPRETEEQADGYLLRAEVELRQAQKAALHDQADKSRWIRLSHADLNRSRDLYEPIAGYSRVSDDNARLERDEEKLQQLEKPPARKTARLRAGKSKGSVRWR